MHRRVHVAEVPLVGRHLPVGVAVEAPQHQEQLVLGEVEVHQRERERVEGEVPGRIPGVLPLVGHGDDVAVQHVEPLGVPHAAPGAAQERVRLVLLQPAVEVEVVELLRPQHPRERLAVDAPLVLAERAGRDPLVELVRVEEPLPERLLERGPERPRRRALRQPELDDLATARRHLQDVARRGLRPRLAGVHGVPHSGDDVAMERVLHVRRRAGLAPEPLRVGLVLREQELRSAVAGERVFAQLGMGGHDGPALPAQDRLLALVPPRPGVAEPQRRKDVQPRRFGAPVVHGHTDEDLLRLVLRVLDEHVEVPVVVEDPGVDELVLELLPRAPAVRVQQVTVRVLALRVLVEVLHVRVGRRRVEVEVVLLDVLAVVPLAVGEAERALLEDGVPLVPEGEREAQALLVVGDPGQSVFAPAVGPGAGLVVREVVPGVAVRAVVLADRAPLPLAEVGAPLLPGRPGLTGLVQPLLLGAVHDDRRRLRHRRPLPSRTCGGATVFGSVSRDLIVDSGAQAPFRGAVTRGHPPGEDSGRTGGRPEVTSR